MIKWFIAVSIFFPTVSMADGFTQSNRMFRCVAGLNQYLAPYAGLPEYAGALEHYRLKRERINDGSVPHSEDVITWDAQVREGSDLRVRHIFTNNVTYQCYYPKDVNPEDLVINARGLKDGDADNILKRNRMLAPGMGISCRKTEIFPSDLLNTYISWSPQLYQELLIDKSSREDFARVGGNYSPGNVMFNGFDSCRYIPGPYGQDLERKRPRFDASWNSILRTQPTDSPSGGGSGRANTAE